MPDLNAVFGVPLPLLLAATGAAAAFLLAGFALFGGREARGRIERRLTKVRQRADGSRQTVDQVSVRRSSTDSSIDMLDRLIKAVVPQRAVLRLRLERTGTKLAIGGYVQGSLVLTLIVGFAGWHVGLPPVPALLAGIAAGLGLPHAVCGYLIARRKIRFMALFPEAIELIVRGIKSGLPVPASIKLVGTEIGDPVGPEFKRVADQMAIGTSLDDALGETAERLDIREFRFFVVSLAVQRETGGNLGETLDNLGDILRRRRQMKLKIKALSSEARAGAMVIGALPFIVFGAISFLNPDYARLLIDDPRGVMMSAVGMFWMLCGFAVMAKMVRFDY